jgi:hypothetical protein
VADTKRFFSKKEKGKPNDKDDDKKKKPSKEADDDCPCDDDEELEDDESPKSKKKGEKDSPKEKGDEESDDEFEDESDEDFSDDEDDVKQKPKKKGGLDPEEDADREDVPGDGNADGEGGSDEQGEEDDDGENIASDPFRNPNAKSVNPFIDIRPVLYSDENDETGESENEDNPVTDPKARGEKKNKGVDQEDQDEDPEYDPEREEDPEEEPDEDEDEPPKKKKGKKGESYNEDNPVKNRRGKKAPVSESVLDVAHRRERGRDARRRKTTLGRARKLASQRFASQSALKRRAQKEARAQMRARVAGKRGERYASLNPNEKMSVDRMLDSDAIQKSIKRLAVRLTPLVRRKESERLQHRRVKGKFRHAMPATHHTEDFDLVMADLVRLLSPDNFEASYDRAITLMESCLETIWDRVEIAENTTCDYDTLETKAILAGIDPEVVYEVFERGVEDWIIETTNLTPAQFAFNRVNSFLNGGKSYKESDKDLVEAIKVKFRDKE